MASLQRFPTLRDSLKAYYQYLSLMKANGTGVKYKQHLEELAKTLGDDVNIAEVKTFDLYLHLSKWEEEHKEAFQETPSAATYNNRVSSIRAFFFWLEKNALLVNVDGMPIINPANGLDQREKKEKMNDWLRQDESDALLAATCGVTEQIIIYLLRYSGLRIEEALSLKCRDVDLENERITVQVSKTAAGRRNVPILPALMPVLKIWIQWLEQHDRYSPTAPFLSTTHGTAMKPSYCWRVIKRVAARAGIRPAQGKDKFNSSEISAHTLRRTFGSDLLNRKVRLEVVSKLLGHSSTVITQQCYAELLDETMVNEALAALT